MKHVKRLSGPRHADIDWGGIWPWVVGVVAGAPLVSAIWDKAATPATS